MNQTFTTAQVTYLVPPPPNATQAQIPNQQLQTTVPVVEFIASNPGVNQSAIPDAFPYGLSDVYSVNPQLTQFYPVNAPPTP